MMNDSVLKAIEESGLVAIVRGVNGEELIRLADALAAGGVSCLEVTYAHKPGERSDTPEAIAALSERFAGRMHIGAGTVLSAEEVRLASEAGAEFIIAPNTDRAVIERAKALGRVMIPGAMTPTEISAAYAMGADIVKVFPAGLLGAEYLKAVRAPLGHIPMLAVANITLESCADFIRAGALGVGISSSLARPEWIKAGRFDLAEQAARDYLAVIRRGKGLL